ncbi:MAG: hypothetical protein ACJATV_000742 [Granulosicoccus sp.]|jgi:hypothetical protein
MESLLVVLLLWISQNTTFAYEPSMGLPKVEQVSQRELAHLYVGSEGNMQGFLSEEAYQSLASGLEAIYAADKNTIYLGEKVDIGTEYGRSVLVHELVHFLQNVHEHHAKVSCGQALEKDAYFTQANYMREHDLKPPFTRFSVLIRSLCEGDAF